VGLKADVIVPPPFTWSQPVSTMTAASARAPTPIRNLRLPSTQASFRIGIDRKHVGVQSWRPNPGGAMIVDCAYYSRGVRQHAEQMPIEEAASCARGGNNYVWIELREPDSATLAEIGEAFGLHELALEDARVAHQRAKVESYDNFHFIVYRTAEYDEATKRVELGELDLFLGVGYVIAVRHGRAGSAERARRHLEQYPQLVRSGPAAAVWAILDTVVDDYRPVIQDLERDVDDIERAIFAGREDLTEQIYELKGEMNEIYRAVHPLLAPLDAMQRGAFSQVDPGLLRYFRDVGDHVRSIQEEVVAQRDELNRILEAHFALTSLRQLQLAGEQNKAVGRLTAIATIFLPLAFVTGFFGQNFGWLTEHTDTFGEFVLFGLGGLVLPCMLILFLFRRGGLV
jgi:magnesium transporter